MGIASDMKNLSEDIVSSYDVRVKAIGILVNNVHRTLKGFSTDRKKMANEQAKALKDFVNELSNSVGNMIEGIQKGHKEMADKLKADLAKGEEERLKGEEERLKDFKTMMADIQKAVKEIETYVKNKLKEFSDAHADMSEELKKELAKYVNDLVNTTKELMGNNKKLMGNIQARQKERNAEVADLLEAFKTEREKMAANWQALTANWQALTAKMAKKRGIKPEVEQALTAKMAKKRGIKPEVEVEVKVRPVEEVVEEVVEEAKEEEVPPEISLEERVLDFIERHPEGVRVGNMEEPLGVTKLRLGKIAKSLLNEGKVRKEDNLYFPLEE